MFTLPVKTWQHIVSKLIVAMVWIMLNTLVTFGSILIMLETPGLWAQLVEAFNVFQLPLELPAILSSRLYAHFLAFGF